MSETTEVVSRSVELPRVRDSRSDDLKAVAILGVVCIHAGLPFADVFRFCVPVFIAIWAFHYELGLTRRGLGLGYVWDRFVRLLIPYAFWTIVYLLLLHQPSEWFSTPLHTIVGGWFGGYGWSGQYFFIILFQLTWVFPVVRMVVSARFVWGAVIIGGVFNAFADYFLFDNRIVRGIGDRMFIYWLPYVFLGCGFARGYVATHQWFLLGALALFAAPFEFQRLTDMNAHGVSVYLLPSVFVGSVSILLAYGPRLAAAVPKKSTTGRIRALFSYLGQQSFSVFLVNPIMLEALWRIAGVPDNSVTGILHKLGIVVAAIAGSLAIGWSLRRIGLRAVV